MQGRGRHAWSAREGAVEQGQSASRQACVAGAAEPVRLSRSEFVGPQVGQELAEDGAKALAFVVIGIMIYLAFRFEWKFSVAAIIANLHDVIIILGFFAFFQWEFSLSVLAAVLAVLGYSVNESVVIFDRIRETFRRYRKLNTHAGDRPRDHQHDQPHHHHPRLDADDGAVDAALRRPDAALLRLALTIGILFGIYSSVFVAAAIAMWLGVKREDLVKAGRPRSTIPTIRTPGRWCRVEIDSRRTGHTPQPMPTPANPTALAQQARRSYVGAAARRHAGRGPGGRPGRRGCSPARSPSRGGACSGAS